MRITRSVATLAALLLLCVSSSSTYAFSVASSIQHKQQQQQQQQQHKQKQQQQQQHNQSKQQRIDGYNRQLKALSSNTLRDKRAAHKAEQLLRQMQRETDIAPTQLSYTNVIVAWSRCSKHDSKAAVRAQALLDEMKQLEYDDIDNIDININDGHRHYLQPSKVPYTAVIFAWSKSRDWNAGQYALALLQEMKAYGTSFCSPNSMTYSACLAALGVSAGRRNGGPVALKLLQECHERFLEGDVTCRPDTVLYTAAISTLAKCGATATATATTGNNNNYYYDQVQQLLSEMEQHEDDHTASSYLSPNHFTYSAAMAACLDRSNTTLSLQRAQSLLHHVKDRAQQRQQQQRLVSNSNNNNDDGVCSPNVVFYNSMLDVCSQCASLEAADLALHILRTDMIQPDCISYCTVIAAVTKSGNPKCGVIAVELLRDMKNQQQSQQSQSPLLKPNTFVYGAAIAAQAKCGNATMAQQLFDEMELAGIRPNTIVYNSLISAWARTPKAHRLWQDMYRRYHDDKDYWVKPNTITYNTVLGGLAATAATTTVVNTNSEQASVAVLLGTAQQLLEDMKRRTAAGESGVKPDTVTYSTLIGIWSNYPGLEAAQKVEELLQEMTRLSSRK